jgi:hypothetical protein
MSREKKTEKRKICKLQSCFVICSLFFVIFSLLKQGKPAVFRDCCYERMKGGTGGKPAGQTFRGGFRFFAAFEKLNGCCHVPEGCDCAGRLDVRRDLRD